MEEQRGELVERGLLISQLERLGSSLREEALELRSESFQLTYFSQYARHYSRGLPLVSFKRRCVHVDGQSFAPFGLHETDTASDWLLNCRYLGILNTGTAVPGFLVGLTLKVKSISTCTPDK